MHISTDFKCDGGFGWLAGGRAKRSFRSVPFRFVHPMKKAPLKLSPPAALLSYPGRPKECTSALWKFDVLETSMLTMWENEENDRYICHGIDDEGMW